MRQIFSTFLLLVLIAFTSYGQTGRSHISGIILEAGSQEPVIQAVVELLNSSDGSRLDAAVSDLDGKFSILVPPGNYTLKFSMLGFDDLRQAISISQSGQDSFIGTIQMEPQTIVLEAAKTIAKVPPVNVVEDTVVYNTAAYRVDDDASITEVLKKIPGLEIEEDKVYLNGNEIKKLMINGQEAYGEDIVTGLKNMPAEMIEKIKAYERQTDEARISGVEDGEQMAVLDLNVKKSFFEGWHTNASGGYGSSGRYNGRYSANRLTDDTQIAAVANIDNENESGLSSVTNQNRLGSGNSGEMTDGSAGITFSQKKEDIEQNGNIRYTGSGSDSIGDQLSETVLKSNTSFASYDVNQLLKKNNVNFNYNLISKPSEKTTIMVKPALNYSKNYTHRTVVGTTFSDKEMVSKLNGSNNLTIKDDYNYKFSLSAQISHRFNDKGRGLTGNVFYTWQGSKTNQYQNYDTYYYKSEKDVLRETDNYIGATSSNFTYWMSYNEPLCKDLSLQTTVYFYYKRDTRDRLADDYHDKSLNESAISIYDYYGMKAIEGLRYGTKKIYSVAGIIGLKQWGTLHYEDQNIKTSSTYFSPLLRFNYTRNKYQILKFIYTGSPVFPTLYNLSPDVNRTNPLSIHTGNPYLKPAYRTDANLSINTSNTKKQSSFILSALYYSISNSASNCTVYDENTGALTITPQNIKGNWKVSGNAVWNKTLKDSRFSICSHSWGEYMTSSAFLYNSSTKENEINRTTRILLREKVEGCYRTDKMELIINATGEFTDERSILRPAMNQKPYYYSFGAAPSVNLPWKMRLSSSFDVLCQKGYDYDLLNKNYLLWNATISQTFLKDRLTARLSAYDLLNQQCNMIRNFTIERRTTTTYNGIHRYAILRLTWRF